ncbi:hypothetical protein Acr_23g0010850 [Actinidia rufa]|uniref:non-specific serine/threonine protein kinase n=1 Tax=Actinidia rufa TaxID=165716 RepID=A0A7J0GPF9_9ERIC|nr:hypothetical protein Acr_23g0010850 [Actinidia rufa]
MPANSSLSPNIFFSFTLILSLNSLFPSPCHSNIDVQGQALLEWKNGFHRSSSTDAVLRNWNSSDQSPCHWFGIHCNSNGQVVHISLKSVDLQGGTLPANFQPLNWDSSTSVTIPFAGEIPAEICRLTKLQTLSLNTNSLQGQIPSDIGNLSSLVYFTLYDNQLTGQIPTSIGKLRNLEIFRAGGNQNLKGQIPREIGNCTNLVMLGLAETSISGNLPSSFGMLKRIQTLAIYAALLSGPIPEEIGNCSELQNLYLYQNSISGSIPRRIGELKRLQSLLLWQNTIVGTIPFELGSCRELMVIDLSENLLFGGIPTSFGFLSRLEELQLSVNQLSGTIPSQLTNCTSLTHLEVDNNNISGEIPIPVGKLKSLTLFFAWQNNLTGKIPESLSECENLQALDLSYNHLLGPIPKQIFSLQNLTKLLLLSNDLSGFVPPDIGNCTNLYRFRVNDNRLSGTIPLEIGNLRNLNFLDLSNNRFVGGIPLSISKCGNLEFLDFHSNGLTGSLPDAMPKGLQFVDISDNRLTGPLSPSTVGSLTELTKLNLRRNQLSGKIPREILSCSKLQLLDLGNNGFSGDIPKELGQIPSLEISLNLSCNQFTGEIPSAFSSLTKLGILDLSHNKLTGNVDTLTTLQNLVSLNVSFNDFSGELPNTPFFRNLPMSDLSGNRALYISGGVATPTDRIGPTGRAKSMVKLAMTILKKEFTIDDIVKNLTSSNVIGTGSSGVVYRVTNPNGQTLAVKKMWSMEELGAFRSEIQTLGSIRHRNIVRLLGWASNKSLKLLFYDYLSNGSLSTLLHGAGKGGRGGEWEARYEVVLGVAHALAYLHHDCVPPIFHGDVKAMNVLLGPHFEPYLADFGLARHVSGGDCSKQSRSPLLVGSYGYMAPGRHPLDPTLPGGAPLVQWVRDHLQAKGDPGDILDPKLRGMADPQMHEMLQTLAVSFLCIATRAHDRPMMKDVVAMLKEIRHADPMRSDSDLLKGGLSALSLSPPTRNVVFHGSSNCSFAFSDDSTM